MVAVETRNGDASTRERTVLALLNVAHALEDCIDRALAPVGLSMSKFGVLTQLVHSDTPLSLSELASRLSCVRSNMTQLVDRLEADGLVRRIDDPSDRRSVLAEVTELGRTRQASGQDELTRTCERFMAPLDDGDRSALDRCLTALAK